MDTRHIIAYVLIALIALAIAALVNQWRMKSRKRHRVRRGRAAD